MNTQKNTFPYWRLVVATLIGGTSIYGTLIYNFMKREIDTPLSALFLSYLLIGVVCFLPMFIAYIKNMKKKETVYWLSFLGVIIPFGTILWVVSLIMSLFAKSMQKIYKKGLIGGICGICIMALFVIICGINTNNVYESSFIIPKWEDRVALNEKESRCYVAAKLYKSRYKQDEVYRDCLTSLKESEKRKQQEEVAKIRKMTSQQKYDAILQSCVNALYKKPNVDYISKYDKQKKANEIKRIEQINTLSKSLCKCSVDLFFKEAEEKEIVDVLTTKPFDRHHYYFISIGLPFDICLERAYPNILDKVQIQQVLGIDLASRIRDKYK